jgi:hypothetical protein
MVSRVSKNRNEELNLNKLRNMLYLRNRFVDIFFTWACREFNFRKVSRKKVSEISWFSGPEIPRSRDSGYYGFVGSPVFRSNYANEPTFFCLDNFLWPKIICQKKFSKNHVFWKNEKKNFFTKNSFLPRVLPDLIPYLGGLYLRV